MELSDYTGVVSVDHQCSLVMMPSGTGEEDKI